MYSYYANLIVQSQIVRKGKDRDGETFAEELEYFPPAPQLALLQHIHKFIWKKGEQGECCRYVIVRIRNHSQ